ncbi:MAG TPA: Clp protease N-terminal domain-containing protein [Acidimicrobiales bacterium]|nr:Clp protease N-terminal domain-containing protein [Acidimicrobiales bacterium]
MTRDVADPGELQGFDAGAARAIALAESEAGQLGHDRVGTEHLLLGLLTNDSDTATMLAGVGVTLAAARNKVSEAVGSSSRGSRDRRPRPLPKTPRATRALGRARRFAHARGSDAVTSRHVLLGVLDVEGIAGQVLRGLGLDVESLRASLDALDAPSPSDRGAESRRRDPATLRPTTCPACNSSLDLDLVYRVVPARDEHGNTRDALVFTCGVCGWFLGAGPA